MSKPTVSVVVPCYNVAGTVAETIASISAQTMPDFEIIAVDNNCTDSTVELLSELARDEPRLRIVKQPVQGLSAARNGGIRAAHGEFIAFLDADDLWDRDYLETHLKNFSDRSVGISYSPVRMIDTAGKPTGQETQPQLRGLTAKDLLRSNPCTSLIMVRRDVFDIAGLFHEQLRSVEDQEWLFRAAVRGVKLHGIRRTLASYRITPGGLSANLEGMLKAHGQMIEAAKAIAPEIATPNQRLAEAGMFRYCARRAMEHSQSPKVARKYLAQMAWTAPEIALLEPFVTLKAIVRVLAPSIKSALPQRLAGLRPGEA